MPDLNMATTSSLSSEMSVYYDRKLLMRAKPHLVYYKWGKKKVIPSHLNAQLTIDS